MWRVWLELLFITMFHVSHDKCSLLMHTLCLISAITDRFVDFFPPLKNATSVTVPKVGSINFPGHVRLLTPKSCQQILCKSHIICITRTAGCYRVSHVRHENLWTKSREILWALFTVPAPRKHWYAGKQAQSLVTEDTGTQHQMVVYSQV